MTLSGHERRDIRMWAVRWLGHAGNPFDYIFDILYLQVSNHPRKISYTCRKNLQSNIPFDSIFFCLPLSKNKEVKTHSSHKWINVFRLAVTLLWNYGNHHRIVLCLGTVEFFLRVLPMVLFLMFEDPLGITCIANLWKEKKNDNNHLANCILNGSRIF